MVVELNLGHLPQNGVGGDRAGIVLTSRERTILAAKATVFWQTYYKLKKKEDPQKDTKGKTITPAEIGPVVIPILSFIGLFITLFIAGRAFIISIAIDATDRACVSILLVIPPANI